MNNQVYYTIPADFLQAVVNNLNMQPAKDSRLLLNFIEELCKQQDESRAAEIKEQEVQAALAAQSETKKD